MNKVILASASPRRQELLRNIIKKFDIIPANIDEIAGDDVPVWLHPQEISRQKAKFIGKNYPEKLVIGCDTAVICDNQILGKPIDRQDAFNMIKMLQGRVHKVITGCTLCYKGKVRSFFCETKVEFNPLDNETIEEYLDIKETLPNGKVQYQWADKAGAYGIQNSAQLLVKSYTGDFNNVVGLPCEMLKSEIKFFLEENKALALID